MVRLCAGLMSGTSVDAVDGALVAFADPAGDPALQTLATRSLPIPAPLRTALQALQQPGPDELARAAQAANALAELYARVVEALLTAGGCQRSEVAAIGAHGQTVRHRPELGYTVQLLNPALLAERTGIAVVADLRSADVAAGGQGAPLAPAFHAAVFGSSLRRRAIVNLGGIANVSLLPAASDHGTAATPVTGFDTGPANTLLDAWCERHLGERFDRDGHWAAGGTVLAPLLAQMLTEPYFAAVPPKSTGRDRFNADWLARMLAASGQHQASPRDVQATLAELTATTVATACASFGAEEVWVCGGGAHNGHLMTRLAAHLPAARVADTGQLGIAAQSVEAIAFAWLAERRLAGLPGNLPAVTGAPGPRLLGAVWPAGGR